MSLGGRQGAAILAAAALVAAAVGVITSVSGGGPKRKAAPTSTERFGTMDWSAKHASPAAFDRLGAAVSGRSVRAIVGLRVRFTPEGVLSARGVARQRTAIRTATRSVLDALRGTEFATLRTYTVEPYLALRLSQPALDALRRSGLAATVDEDLLLHGD